jgi:hypothetical protein
MATDTVMATDTMATAFAIMATRRFITPRVAIGHGSESGRDITGGSGRSGFATDFLQNRLKTYGKIRLCLRQGRIFSSFAGQIVSKFPPN